MSKRYPIIHTSTYQAPVSRGKHKTRASRRISPALDVIWFRVRIQYQRRHNTMRHIIIVVFVIVVIVVCTAPSGGSSVAFRWFRISAVNRPSVPRWCLLWAHTDDRTPLLYGNMLCLVYTIIIIINIIVIETSAADGRCVRIHWRGCGRGARHDATSPDVLSVACARVPPPAPPHRRHVCRANDRSVRLAAASGRRKCLTAESPLCHVVVACELLRPTCPVEMTPC